MGVREKSLEEFYRDIEQPAGRAGFRSVRAEKRQDPVLPLKRPLEFYDDRTFFYVGLLYGFCRLDASITERFREATGSSLRTEMYEVGHPLMTVRGFSEFSRTRVSRLLSAVENGPLQQALLDFLSSQLIVDRQRGRVWRCRIEMRYIEDPFLVDARHPSSPPSLFRLPIFVPYQHDQAYVPVQVGNDLEVRCLKENHPELLKEQQEVLNGKS